MIAHPFLCTCPNCGHQHARWAASNGPLVIIEAPDPLDEALADFGRAARAWAPHFPPEARADPLPLRRPPQAPPHRPAWPVALRAFS